MEQISIIIVLLSALAIPILMARFKISGVPTAVAEIVMGIIIGKSGFNLVQTTDSLTQLSTLGVIILMFLSGMEIDFSLFKRQPANNPTSKTNQGPSPVKMALLAFLGNVINAVILSFILRYLGLFNDAFLATILFCTIALGVVIATLKEKEILSRPMGQTILLTAVLGEVTPMFALTVYASIYGGGGSRLWMISLLFIAAIILLWRFKRPYAWFTQISKATTQLDIRLAFFLIFSLVVVAESVGAENILGAFLAGMVMKLLEPSEATRDKLTSIGYGFFIPIFFIMTGVRLNLRQLMSNPKALTLIPVLVACFILAKFWSYFIYHRRFNRRNSFAGGFLTVTTITLVLPSLQVAQNLHMINETQNGAFILAAIIVCIISPIIFNSFYRLDREDLIRQRVVFLGTNVLTVPVAQQLAQNWYDIRMVTDEEANYKTYNSEVPNLTYLPEVALDVLKAKGFLDADIIVLGFQTNQKNLPLAKEIKQNSQARVITAVINRDLDDQAIQELNDLDIEIFNPFNVQAGVLRSLIMSPSVYEMLIGTHAALYEVRIRNHRYAGIELRDLPFVADITVSRIIRDGHWIEPSGASILEVGDRLIFTAKDLGTASTVRRELNKPN